MGRRRRRAGMRDSRPRCETHGKVIFRSRAAAIEALAAYDLMPGAVKPVREYRDPGCGCWHLTSQPLRT